MMMNTRNLLLLAILCASCRGEPERCDDGVDNDGDALVDCDDEDCSSDPACADTGEPVTDADGDGYDASEHGGDDCDDAVHPAA